jgi:hypothetical protein
VDDVKYEWQYNPRPSLKEWMYKGWALSALAPRPTVIYYTWVWKKVNTFKPETDAGSEIPLGVEHNGLKVSKKFLEELIAYISFTTVPVFVQAGKHFIMYA